MVLYSGANGKSPVKLLVQNQSRQLVGQGERPKRERLAGRIADFGGQAEVGPDQKGDRVGPLLDSPSEPSSQLGGAASSATAVERHEPTRVGKRGELCPALGGEPGRPLVPASDLDRQLADSRPPGEAFAVVVAEALPIVVLVPARPDNQDLSTHPHSFAQAGVP